MNFLNAFLTRLNNLLSVDILAYNQSPTPLIFELDLSVLAGEYYSTTDHNVFYVQLKTQFTTIQDCLGKLKLKLDAEEVKLDNPRSTESASEIGYKRAKLNKFRQLVGYFEAEHKLYLKLAENAERDFSEYGRLTNLYKTNKIFDLNIVDEIHRHKHDEVNNSEELEYDIFQINIKLAEIDINLDCDDNTVGDLNAIKNFLEKHQGLSNEFTRLIIKILLDKCKFFLIKLYLRKLKQHSAGSDEYEFYSAETKNLRENLDFYVQFLGRTDEHYFDWHGSNGALLSLKNKALRESLTLGEIHRASKLFRQTNNIDGVKKMIELNTKLKSIDYNKFNFDSFAMASATNLLANTELRLKLQEETGKRFANVIDLLRSGKKSEFLSQYLYVWSGGSFSSTEYIDYYPFILLFKFFNRLLDYLLAEPLTLLTDDQRKKLLEEGKNIDDQIQVVMGPEGPFAIMEYYFEQLSQQYSRRFRFCNQKKYKPIYLSFEECRYTVKEDVIAKHINPKQIAGYSIDLFVESSYILPDDYSLIGEKNSAIKERLREKLERFKGAFIIETQLRFYEKSFRKEVENKEFKLVQALAMFIAIATLILGTIKATENRSVLSSVIIIISLGGVLMLFNYFIYWFIRVDKRIMKREIWVMAIILAVISGALVFSRYNDDALNTLKYKSDSLKLYQRADTIFSKKIKVP